MRGAKPGQAAAKTAKAVAPAIAQVGNLCSNVSSRKSATPARPQPRVSRISATDPIGNSWRRSPWKAKRAVRATQAPRSTQTPKCGKRP